jgi:hypothetical protein
MKTIRPILVIAFLMILGQQAFSHALWIEVNAHAQKGQSQQVKIFYGEFATGELEPVEKWYADVKSFSLWLTGPNQKSEKITVSQQDNHFVASFTPDLDGIYYLSVVHDASEIAGNTKYEFSSLAAVQVGKNPVANHSSIKNTLKVITPSVALKTGSATTVKVYLDGNPFTKGKVLVTSENGWGKEFSANEAGEVTFSPVWKGKYVLEATNFKKGAGQLNGKAYESTWQGATTVIYVQ